MDLSVIIAGAAGEGVQTVGEGFARAALQTGHRVFAVQEYESRIRGGQSSFRVRLTATVENAPRLDGDILFALNPRAEDAYRSLVTSGGLILGEGDPSPLQGGRALLPFARTAESLGDRRMANMLAAGALGSVLGLEGSALEASIRVLFAGKPAETLGRNLSAARRGAALAEEAGVAGLHALPPLQRASSAYLLSGNAALSLGAAAAGCTFMSAYPMSPSTEIITALTRDEGLGVFTEQAEDEIAAINMALGASAAGARAMTATSGGGFALMVESLSLAGMTETPIVIVLAQRPGPATGLPTRTEQGDLLFALHAGHGEFPRALLAPSDPRSAFTTMRRAFDLAERFQIPVIVLSDQLLADSLFSFEEPPFEMPALAEAMALHPLRPYRRYEVTESGVSPRLFLGETTDLVVIDSDEHDEAGHLTEDLARTRPRMVEKRLRKGVGLRGAMLGPERYRVEDARTVLVGWGTTRGAMKEAVDRGRDRGERLGMLHFTDLWPLPPVGLPTKPRLVSVEGNATGQLATLLAREEGAAFSGAVRRYDGLPITAAEIEKGLHGRD